jgi:hypothetical protein
MTERTPPHTRLLGPTSPGETRIAAAARPSEKRTSSAAADYLETPKSSSPILKRSKSFENLVIQLALDPSVQSLSYVDSLPAWQGRVKVKVAMLVAERDDRRIAFDLVDERAVNDLDSEGLLLLALEENHIELLEVDRGELYQQPKAGNCLQIWNNRSYLVDDSARIAIVRALEEHSAGTTVRRLGEIAGLSSPLKAVCALAWKGIISVDISRPLDLDSEATLIERHSPTSMQQPSNRGPR